MESDSEKRVVGSFTGDAFSLFINVSYVSHYPISQSDLRLHIDSAVFLLYPLLKIAAAGLQATDRSLCA